MTIQLPELPYAANGLAPHISERTIGYHYGKHHAAYVKAVNELTVGTPNAEISLEALVRSLIPGDNNAKLFNAAAQAWNHDFYWNSMSPAGGGEPAGDLADALEASFGSVDEFRRQFAAAAVGNFASGWGWLVYDSAGTAGTGASEAESSAAGTSGTEPGTLSRTLNGTLRIVQTDDASTPIAGTSAARTASATASTAAASRLVPLLVIDVWEHAYYLDYQNARAAYVDAFVEHLVCWEFASANYAAALRNRT